MPLPKFSLQFAFSWSVYFSNRTGSYSSQIEFAGPHGIICNITFSYLILSKTIGRKRFRTQSLVGADLGQLVYTYKRVVCVCLLVGLFVCLLFIGQTTFVHFAALPPSVREQPSHRGQAHVQREHARACRTTSQRKNRALDAFQKQNCTRAHAVVYATAEIFKKKGKRKPTCHFQIQFTVCLLLECLLFESY